MTADPTAPTDARIQGAIETLLAAREEGRTICPSEAARALADGGGEDAWRVLMDDVRRVAVAMADDGALVVTQGGEVVDGRTARGPVRLRRS